ncbi:hypothetical protein [Streptomyces sp. Wb2n-11]|nr:hypothetical protein [Streptomyces sp. Wb2n-11]
MSRTTASFVAGGHFVRAVAPGDVPGRHAPPSPGASYAPWISVRP